ncbi:hypothetical protein N8J30_004249 [Salmonella enterica subsp. enterica serovar Newport]|uniref:hypothetical protein n=1 Tax=Salmonella sp. SAL04162 TaxID=3159782 RepID=UPI00280789EC|nr:hypothetical protein [Salmonella enterica subsp. enterica serovar Newport]EJW0497118.1 hypothetical protein [Salmonella enterica subsp. enterica serovar Newport]ELA5318832.1 hypothetical protein [Salmonella enterica subsp. enterica serovar Newport]MDJ3787828.1 hypothetical protein [Salmonella enterica]MDJ6367154.1 hypothetical protein [Salmonella enterica]
MDLSKIHFRGFEVNSSSLQIHSDKKGGAYRIKFDDFSITHDNDGDGNWLHVDIKQVVEGTTSDNGKVVPAFKVTVSLTLFFVCDFAENKSEEFYRSNFWFFENFALIATKISVDSILKNTALEAINLPWS